VVEDAVSYAVGHRIRIEIRAILNEGVRTHEELAYLTGQPSSKVGHHIKELVEDGSIEIAYVKPVRNTIQHYYRAVNVPFYSDDEVAAMPPEARQATAGVILQALMAEAQAAFWAGKMIHDRRVWLSWRWFNVDSRGREDIADDLGRSWTRVQEIEAESAARCVVSGESTKSIIVTLLGFERFRFSSSPPDTTPNSDETAVVEPIRLGQGKRTIEDAVSYAISHRIRIEILAILNEGVHTRDQLADLTGQSPTRIKHHIKELLDDGSIELAYTKRVGNLMQHYYRAVKMPFYSDEEIAAMPPEVRQATAGVILQAVMAEAQAAFWAGKMVQDRRVWLSWRWFNVDSRGREEIADELARSWKRMREIEAESATRSAISGESTKSIIVTSLGFERFRPILSGRKN